MSEDDAKPPAQTWAGRLARFRPLIRDVAVDILLPWLVYAVLEHWFPSPSTVPLLAAAAIPAVEFAVMFTRKRRFDAIALISLSQYLAALAITLASRNPHQSMVGHALQPAALGLVFALSCLIRKPLTVALGRQALAGGDPERRRRYDLGAAMPQIRMHFYLIAGLWAVALTAETIVRLLILQHVSVRDYILTANILGYATPSLLTWASLRYGQAISRKHR